MGWDNVAPKVIESQMSHQQEMEIIRLREQHDCVAPGTYAGDAVAKMDKFQASREIDRLRARIEGKPRRVETKCCFCMQQKPCGCRLSRAQH